MSKYENKNALKHGAFAEVVILPNEDSKEFEELHDTVLCEWNPEGPTEHGLVMSLTKDLWRKRRIGRFYQRNIEKILERRRELERLDKIMIPLLESVLFEPGSENCVPSRSKNFRIFWGRLRLIISRPNVRVRITKTIGVGYLPSKEKSLSCWQTSRATPAPLLQWSKMTFLMKSFRFERWRSRNELTPGSKRPQSG